jgi:competence ComEA-like helix-hairpin-helix protein
MQRWKVWLPVVAKAVGIVGILLVLAGIGSVSLLYGWNGVAIARGASSATPTAGSEWLAGTDETRPPEAVSSDGDAAVPAPLPGQSGLTADGKVILNLASADELRHIPGVGQKRAEAILKLREKLKRFRRANELLRVKGIGPRSLKRMQAHFVLDPPPPASSPMDGGTRD